MSGWLPRWQLRQRELLNGAGADLVHTNRRPWKLCMALNAGQLRGDHSQRILQRRSAEVRRAE